MSGNLTRFNNQISALIDALKKVDKISGDKTIHIFELKYNTIVSLDSKKPLECFIKYVYPYKEHIMKKNEAFFLGDDMTQRVNEITDNLKNEDDIIVNSIKENDEFILHQALNIQNHWNTNLTDAQKNVIWTYFQVLVKLAERYVVQKVDLNKL